MCWETYFNNRKIRYDDGYYVIIPDGTQDGIPISCPVCKFLYRNSDDEHAHVEFKCCHACSLAWAEANRAKWRDGWRPDDKTIKAHVEGRSKLAVTLQID